MTNLVTLLLLLATGNATVRSQIAEHVALIELNHFYDASGKPVYDQVMFYELAPETGRFQVRAWCLVEDREQLNRRPVRDQVTDLVTVDWYDVDRRVRRRITSKLFRESWTQSDPERDNKRVHPEKLRIGLATRPNLEPPESQ